jgi:hypothetical protein
VKDLFVMNAFAGRELVRDVKGIVARHEEALKRG